MKSQIVSVKEGHTLSPEFQSLLEGSEPFQEARDGNFIEYPFRTVTIFHAKPIQQKPTGLSESDLLITLRPLLNSEHSSYHEAVLNEFVRDDKAYPESVGYTASGNFPLEYQHVWTELYKRVGDLRGMRVLEIGTGPGVPLERLREAGGVDVVGIDADPRFVKFAQARGVPLIQSEMRTVPKGLEGKTFPVTYSHWYLDALAATADLLGHRRRGLMPHEEKLQVLSTIAALTAPGGWSIHQTRDPVPFTDDEFRSAGFDVIDIDPSRTFVVLRKRSEAPARESPAAPDERKVKSFGILNHHGETFDEVLDRINTARENNEQPLIIDPRHLQLAEPELKVASEWESISVDALGQVFRNHMAISGYMVGMGREWFARHAHLGDRELMAAFAEYLSEPLYMQHYLNGNFFNRTLSGKLEKMIGQDHWQQFIWRRMFLRTFLRLWSKPAAPKGSPPRMKRSA